MNNNDKLKKIAEIALRRGWRGLFDYTDDGWFEEAAEDDGVIFIFSHDFLKAYFGEEEVIPDVPNWVFRAEGLILAEDRIEYLWEHRPEGGKE